MTDPQSKQPEMPEQDPARERPADSAAATDAGAAAESGAASESDASITATDPVAPVPPRSPGARLAAAREERGWSIEQVAAHLKLAPRQILALERDDHAALPGAPIVRGFVRSYAKLLKVDPAPLLAELGGETTRGESLSPKEGLAAPFSEARLPSMSERPAMSSRWIVGVLLLVLVAAALWATGQGEQLSALMTPEPAAVRQEPVAAPQTAEPASANAPDAAQQVEQGEQDSTAEQSAQAQGAATDAPAATTESTAPVRAAEAPTTPPAAQTATRPAPSPAASTQAAARSAAAPAAPAAATPSTSSTRGSNTLNVTAREESWVEIRRAGSGATLAARLAQPGETIAVEVNEPVVLVIGNAAGVDASLRGAPLELKGSTTTNVARLTLK